MQEYKVSEESSSSSSPLLPFPCPKAMTNSGLLCKLQPLLYVNEYINLKLNRHFSKEDITDG